MHPEISGLAFRPDLLAAGLTDDELRTLCRRRLLATLRPGAYVPALDTRLDDPVARYALAARAAVPKVAPDAVLSHLSAAVLHGVPAARRRTRICPFDEVAARLWRAFARGRR